MDFSSEFLIPPPPSQIIDSCSDTEDDIKNNNSDEDGDSSPIFRRSMCHSSSSSPVFSSNRKRHQSTPTPPPDETQTVKVVRRSLNQVFKTKCSDGVAVENEGDEVISFDSSSSPCVSQSSPASSQVVSSCHSTERPPQPQPINDAIKPVLTASSFLANLEDDEDSEDISRSNSVVMDENVHNSGKKKRHVKNGFVEQLQKALQQKQSKEHLEKYQVNNENLNSEVSMKILEVHKHNDMFLIVGGDFSILLNLDFCPQIPSKGDTICFIHPRISKTIQGKTKVLLGVLKFSIISKSNELVSDEGSEKLSTLSLKCPCQESPEGKCDNAYKNFDLCSLKEVPTNSPLKLNQSPVTSANKTKSPGSENLFVTNIVDKFGGASGSPKTSFTLSRNVKFSIELIVHRIFFQSKLDTNQDYPVLLCEDGNGEFLILKLSSELSSDLRWRILFGDDWETIIGSKLLLNSPFHIQHRYTRSQSFDLFNLIRSIRMTDQRFCYVFKCFAGSSFSFLENKVTDILVLEELPQVESHDQRLNMKVQVFHYEPKHSSIYALLQSEKQNYYKVIVKKPFPTKKFLDDTKKVSFITVIHGLKMDQYGSLFLDGYSSFTNIINTSKPDLTYLTPKTKSSQVGDLVKIVGVVTKINEEMSLQWIECSTCGSDEVQEDQELGWNCDKCGVISDIDHKFELVCRVGIWWCRLNNSAKTILLGINNTTLGEFHPGDVIGQQVEEVVGVIGFDGIIDEI